MTNPFPWLSSHRSCQNPPTAPVTHRRLRGMEQLPASPLQGATGPGSAAQPLGHPAEVTHGFRETPRQGVTDGDYSQFASQLFWELPERYPFSLAAKKRYGGRKKVPPSKPLSAGCWKENPWRCTGRNPNTNARHNPCRHVTPGQIPAQTPVPASQGRGHGWAGSCQPQPHRSHWSLAQGDPREGTKPLPLGPPRRGNEEAVPKPLQ